MKTIKIFVASSDELREERLELSDLFAHLNSVFKCRGVELEISKWEFLDESMSHLRKQEEYNREIKTCDMCLVLYWTKIGDYTREELEVAYNELQAGRKPYKLYIYFKEVGEIGKDVMEFKAGFERHYGHFYCKYENIDTLKLRFVLQLENYQNSGAIKVEDSMVKADGIALVSLDNIPFASNNERYRELKQRMAKLREEINSFETVLKAAPNEVIENMLNDKRSEYHELSEELSKHEQALFGTALRMAQYTGQRVSERMQRAMALFEEGKVSEANAVLDEAERDADAILAAYHQAKENAVLSVDELLLKASVMLADTAFPVEERIAHSGVLYNKALTLSRECDIEMEKFSKVLDEYCDYLYKYAKYEEAMSVAKEKLELDKGLFGEYSADVAGSYNNIGAVYSSQGNYPAALEYYNKALEIRLAIFGECHPDVAVSYNNIGVVYDSQGNYPAALEHYNKALGIQLAIFGECHPDVANSYNNIGNVYSSQGNYPAALEHYNKALEIRLAIFGERHPDVAVSYNNIGAVYSSQGNYPAALEHYNKALEIRLAIFGERHPDVADCYNNIGGVYNCQGDYSAALEHYKKALEIQLAIFGEHHPDVAGSYNSIGLAFYNQGNYPAALEHYNKALEIRLAIFGEGHPDVADCYNNIGVVYNCQGDYSAALEHYNKALEIQLAIFGERHPAVAGSYNGIGGVFYGQGNYSVALEHYNKALDIKLEIFGERHPDVATGYNNIGLVYDSQGNYPAALENYNKALCVFIELFGKHNPYTASICASISRLYFSQGKYFAALKYYWKGL